MIRIASAILGCAIISGCSTYHAQTGDVRTFIESGDYAAATLATDKLSTDGKDRLLHYMESGLVHNLGGDYEVSNAKLTQAAVISEELTTKRARDMLKVALSSPRQGPYPGQNFERAFVHYYKALNYIMMAVQQPQEKVEHLESARIEARKVDILLSDISYQKGTYDEAKDEEGKLFSQLMNIFDALNGKAVDKDKIIYREDAYIRYINGLTFESNGELDSARIAYQKAAELYEKGYSEQYDLGQEIVNQAWYDTIRIMKKDGGYENEWPALAKQKLPKALQDKLESDTGAEIVIIGHAGWVPDRKELNMHLTLDERNKQLVLKPFLTGGPAEREAQRAWFHLMYSDRGFLHLLGNLQTRGVVGALEGLNSKRVSLGPLWSLAQSINLPAALSPMGVRVTVPYYALTPKPYGETEVFVNNKTEGVMAEAESIANIAFQGQLLSANSDLQKALGRTVTKNLLCAKMSSYAALACKLAAGLSSQAETRSWLMLPRGIYVKRIAVEPGTHQVRINTPATNGGLYHEATHTIVVGKGNLAIVQERILPGQLVKPALVSNN